MERVLFSVSEHPITGDHSTYDGVRKMFDNINHDFVFAGSPFPDLPHPLSADPADRKRLTTDPIATLCNAWDIIGACAIDVILPAFAAGKAVVLANCGLDLLFGLTYANPDLADELFNLHHMLVREKLSAHDIPAPYYFLVRGAAADDDRRFRERFPGTDADTPAFLGYLEQLRAFERKYLGTPGQNPGIKLDASLSSYGRQQQVYKHLLNAADGEPALEQAA